MKEILKIVIKKNKKNMGSSPIKSAIRKKSDAAKNSKGSAIKDVLSKLFKKKINAYP